MFSYCTNYAAAMPDITVYMNCDTRLAINLRMFNLGDNDEFIFIIKNYNYINSPYAFIFRARKSDMDQNGEVIFRISPEASKRITPGACYNFAVLFNAFDSQQDTEYRKLTENGKILVEYGAQDLTIGQETFAEESDYEIISVRLEPIASGIPSTNFNTLGYEVVGIRLEAFTEEA